MKYPALSEELVNLLEEDQREVKAHSALFKSKPSEKKLKQSAENLRKNADHRTTRVLEIIDEIGTPTKDKISWHGIEAITVIALHSKHSLMKKILEHLQQAPEGQVDKKLLPALIDRVRVLDGQKQLFGTQWFKGFQDKPYLYPVENFQNMNKRRKEYGLSEARRPRDLTEDSRKEATPPLATEADQHQPSKEELDVDLSPLYG